MLTRYAAHHHTFSLPIETCPCFLVDFSCLSVSPAGRALMTKNRYCACNYFGWVVPPEETLTSDDTTRCSISCFLFIIYSPCTIVTITTTQFSSFTFFSSFACLMHATYFVFLL